MECVGATKLSLQLWSCRLLKKMHTSLIENWSKEMNLGRWVGGWVFGRYFAPIKFSLQYFKEVANLGLYLSMFVRDRSCF